MERAKIRINRKRGNIRRDINSKKKEETILG
jgi:hypothetical protein